MGSLFQMVAGKHIVVFRILKVWIHELLRLWSLREENFFVGTYSGFAVGIPDGQEYDFKKPSGSLFFHVRD
jgi:hypothetical protein